MPQLGAAGADPIVPANNRLLTVLEKLHSALQKIFRRAGSIAPPLGPPGRAGVEHWVGARYGACRSTHGPSVVWLCGLDGVESSLVHEYAPSPRRVYRALKKITEAPYTTKVNNRGKG